MALFLTFEGGEGSGKSFQAKSIYKRLSKQKIPVVLTHEPGGTQLGEYVRQMLKWTNAYISPETELLMFNASRAQLLNEVIFPNIKAEKVVICDRYTDSTIAYQGYGRGIDLEMVNSINNFTIRGLKPDLTILLDISPQEGLTRIVGREKDRFEQEDIAFHNRVRDGYLKMAVAEPERWLVIDATQPKEKIAQIIWKRVRQLISSRSTEKEFT